MTAEQRTPAIDRALIATHKRRPKVRACIEIIDALIEHTRDQHERLATLEIIIDHCDNQRVLLTKPPPPPASSTQLFDDQSTVH